METIMVLTTVAHLSLSLTTISSICSETLERRRYRSADDCAQMSTAITSSNNSSNLQ